MNSLLNKYQINYIMVLNDLKDLNDLIDLWTVFNNTLKNTLNNETYKNNINILLININKNKTIKQDENDIEYNKRIIDEKNILIKNIELFFDKYLNDYLIYFMINNLNYPLFLTNIKRFNKYKNPITKLVNNNEYYDLSNSLNNYLKRNKYHNKHTIIIPYVQKYIKYKSNNYDYKQSLDDIKKISISNSCISFIKILDKYNNIFDKPMYNYSCTKLQRYVKK